MRASLVSLGIMLAGATVGAVVGTVLDLLLPVPAGLLALVGMVGGGFAALQYRKFH